MNPVKRLYWIKIFVKPQYLFYVIEIKKVWTTGICFIKEAFCANGSYMNENMSYLCNRGAKYGNNRFITIDIYDFYFFLLI